MCIRFMFFFSSRRRHTRCSRDWSSDVCSSDLEWVLARVGFDAALAKAQLVITGEGSFDRTSLVGKASGEVVRRAQVARKKVAGVAGRGGGVEGVGGVGRGGEMVDAAGAAGPRRAGGGRP